MKTKLQAGRKPRRANGKADRAARRARWDAEVASQLMQRYGVEPFGPDIPDLLTESFQSQRSPYHTAQMLGERFKMAELETWRRRGEL